ncbi:ATP-binding protein [Microbacterium sp. X-17]|uniref:sensor histidine kinase n=1 Tax=Microbacterium sp. X-17 TaxID=3144404 RepID=UPI0031F5C527
MSDERLRRLRWLPAVGVAAYLAGTLLQVAAPSASHWDAALIGSGIAVLLATYPDGRVRYVWAAAAAILMIGLCAALPIAPGLLITPWWNPLILVLSAVLVVGALTRYASSLDTGDRERVRWAALGALVTFGGMGTLVVMSARMHPPGIGSLGPAGNAAAAVFVFAFAACVIVGLVAPRLLPVDSILWWLIALGLAAAALGGVAAIIDPWGSGWSTAAVAVLALPVVASSAWLATGIVYRGRRSPRASGERFQRRLEATGRAEAAPAVLVTSIAESLRSAGVAFDVGGVVSAETGRLRGDEEQVSIAFNGSVLGALRIAPRPGETTLTRRDRAVVAELARRAAPALHDAATVTELQHTRDRLIRAREEERRELRRELHDDLSPALAGVALAADGLVRSLPQGADRQAASTLLADAKDAAARARELAYGLRPAVLDDRGLLAAIHDRVGADSRVEIHAASLPDSLPAAVELAALRIVQEAVTNARRHADATRIAVHIGGNDGAMRIRVEDDGVGIPALPAPGMGLRSIRDRAEELGGSARIAVGSLGGTLVEASLPLGAP